MTMSEKTRVRYYKATRPDGTDFRTGEIDYGAALKSGETIEHPEKFVRNEPSTYFSVSTSPADCTGMRWPCRLFRIEPVGRAWRNDEMPNKRCCSRLRVVEELPAHEALGPQGEEVAALIERCGTLTVDELERLAVAWVAARAAAWSAAWSAARSAARDAARGAARSAARSAARAAAWDAAWSAARSAARAAAWDAAWSAAWSAARAAAWSAARDAAWDAAWVAARVAAWGDAALALVTRDLISQEHFDTLYGPWAQVIDKETSHDPS